MKKSSIVRLIMASLLAMNLGFGLIVSVMLLRSWSNYRLAERGVTLTQIDRILYDASVVIRRSVSVEQTALLSDEDPSAAIENNRRNIVAARDRVLATLAASDLSDRQDLAEGINRAWERIPLQIVDEEMQKRRSDRSMDSLEEWRQSILDLVMAVNTASVAAGNAVRLVDPITAEMVEVRRYAWIIRDSFGRQCSLLRGSVATGRALDSQHFSIWRSDVGTYSLGWRVLEDLLSRPGASPDLVDAMRRSRESMEGTQKHIDQIVNRLAWSGEEVMPVVEWTRLCTAPYPTILDLGYKALDTATQRSEAVRKQARSDIAVTAVGLTLFMALNGWILVMTVLRLARPMQSISQSVSRLLRHEYLTPVPQTGFADELGSIATALENFRVAAAEAEKLRNALEENGKLMERLSGKLSKYLSPQVCRSLLTGEKDTELVTQRKKLTIFFSDIKDFTKTTENMQPEDLSYLLNSYFNEMSKIALQYGATIDKFIGDAMLMFFGDPETAGVKQDAETCVRMAVAMQRRMRKLQATWHFRGYQSPFHMRIGINTGYCNVGNFGSENRMDYTIIGGEVNLAARLEALADPDGILISADTYALGPELIN